MTCESPCTNALSCDAPSHAILVNATGVSVLVVEQDVERALDAASRGYLLIEGRMVASGTTRQLRDTDEVRQRVLGM